MTDVAIILICLMSLQTVMALVLLPIAYVQGIKRGNETTEFKAITPPKPKVVKPTKSTKAEKEALEANRERARQALDYINNFDPMKQEVKI